MGGYHGKVGDKKYFVYHWTNAKLTPFRNGSEDRELLFEIPAYSPDLSLLKMFGPLWKISFTDYPELYLMTVLWCGPKNQ